jgi:hypothetical protein
MCVRHEIRECELATCSCPIDGCGKFAHRSWLFFSLRLQLVSHVRFGGRWFFGAGVHSYEAIGKLDKCTARPQARFTSTWQQLS